MEIKIILLYIMALLFISAGTMHFTKTVFFLKIVPPFLPWRKALVYISGVAEILLGIGLVPEATRSLAAWGLVALLIAVFPANIYHFTSKGAGMKIPTWLLAVRLPIQFVLIAWAWWYT
ncbi:MAG: DoxX-like family protein [Leptospiraceae bacterium]|nr:DoxX-like family protein [Leptospiraceae bacterium]